jgi:protein tyrosine phosphatase (PTP) superfamily phosphohydrolase (DUF442 family)
MIPVLSLLTFVQPSPSPAPVEIQSGLFILPGSPDAHTLALAKALGITHVINLRTTEEGDFEWEATAVQDLGGTYLSCPLSSNAISNGLDLFRTLMSSLPPTAKVLVHCASGNRAGGALFAFWTLNKAMPVEEALVLAKRAGLRSSSTESAVKAYVTDARSAQVFRRFSLADSD